MSGTLEIRLTFKYARFTFWFYLALALVSLPPALSFLPDRNEVSQKTLLHLKILCHGFFSGKRSCAPSSCFVSFSIGDSRGHGVAVFGRSTAVLGWQVQVGNLVEPVALRYRCFIVIALWTKFCGSSRNYWFQCWLRLHFVSCTFKLFNLYFYFIKMLFRQI